MFWFLHLFTCSWICIKWFCCILLISTMANHHFIILWGVSCLIVAIMKRKSRSIWERLPSYIEEHIFKMGASQPPSVVGIIYITFGTFQMSINPFHIILWQNKRAEQKSQRNTRSRAYWILLIHTNDCLDNEATHITSFAIRRYEFLVVLLVVHHLDRVKTNDGLHPFLIHLLFSECMECLPTWMILCLWYRIGFFGFPSHDFRCNPFLRT